jgi:hypothetical protein
MPRDTRSPEALAYRKLYKTARWQKTRADQLAKQPLCETCLSQKRITPATVCNHDDPETKKNPETFFAGPFSSQCAPCHDSVIQKQEKRGHVIGCDENGWPLGEQHHWNLATKG